MHTMTGMHSMDAETEVLHFHHLQVRRGLWKACHKNGWGPPWQQYNLYGDCMPGPWLILEGAQLNVGNHHPHCQPACHPHLPLTDLVGVSFPSGPSIGVVSEVQSPECSPHLPRNHLLQAHQQSVSVTDYTLFCADVLPPCHVLFLRNRIQKFHFPLDYHSHWALEADQQGWCWRRW